MQSPERQQMQISVPLNKKGIALLSELQDKKKGQGHITAIYVSSCLGSYW